MTGKKETFRNIKHLDLNNKSHEWFQPIEIKTSIKYTGVKFDNYLSWRDIFFKFKLIANTCTCKDMQRKMKAFERKKKVSSH